jgi:hypothetical protein
MREPLVSINGDFFDELNYYQLLRTDSTPCSSHNRNIFMLCVSDVSALFV